MNTPATTPVSIFALTPPQIPLMTKPITDPVAHGGLSIVNHYKDSAGVLCLFGPWLNQALFETVSLWLNDRPTPVVSEIVMSIGDPVVLRLPAGVLVEGYNHFYCTIERPSGNGDKSTELIMLYHINAPGGDDPDSATGHSQLSIGVNPTSVDAAQAAKGVILTLDYPHKQLYDLLTINCGGFIFTHRIEPTPEEPVPDLSQPIVLTLYANAFAKDPNNPRFQIQFSVTSQLGNYSGTTQAGQANAQDLWSVPFFIDVHLDRVALEMPILQEVLGDNSDDPTIVDLGKLKGGPLWALVHLIDAIWDVGDEIHLMFTVVVNGSVVVTYDATLPITQVPGQFSWDIPNNKVLAKSIVSVRFEQIRGGKVVGISNAAEAQVIGESAPDLKVTFTNAPFTVAPAGWVKDIQLNLTRAGQPMSGIITVVLPVGTHYADGTGGARDFNTQSDGTLTIRDVKGAIHPGAYFLTASSAGHTETATLTITAQGGLGPIAVGSLIQGIAISADGTRVYVSPANGNSVAEIDTASSTVMRYIPVQDHAWVQFALSKDRSRAYGDNYVNRSMEVLDIEHSMVIASFPVGRAGFNVALSRDEALAFVSNSHDDTVNVIDIRNLRPVKTITVGGSPNQIASHPDGSRIYVAIVSSRSIAVIDTRTLTIIGSFPLKAPPIGIAISPDGNSIYADVVINNSVEEILQINTHTGALIRAISVTGLARGITVNHAGTRAYCCNPHTHTVSTIDIALGAVIQRTNVGRLPLRIAISPDDTFGYVVCHEDGTVWVIPLQPSVAGGEAENIGGLDVTNSDSEPRRPIPGDKSLGL